MNKDDKEAFAQKIAQMEDSGTSSIEMLREMLHKEKALRKEAEDSLAYALSDDARQKEADALMMNKLERINELENINDSHKEFNGKLQLRLTEVEEDNKKLAQQVEDLSNIVQKLRSDGVL
jgi:DNA repair ATPase RecN